MCLYGNEKKRPVHQLKQWLRGENMKAAHRRRLGGEENQHIFGGAPYSRVFARRGF